VSAKDRARAVAMHAHGDQKYGDEPYVVHLDEVAALCEPYGEEAVVVAYLHDALEDTDLPPEAVETAFGAQARATVEALTDPPMKTRKERKAASYAKLAAIASDSPIALALVVKAADRLANVRRCVLNANSGLLDMYRKEQPDFDRAVRRAGLNDALMDEVTILFR
jgi:(p)ppGpp synthase/HD superfamily hydrolase